MSAETKFENEPTATEIKQRMDKFWKERDAELFKLMDDIWRPMLEKIVKRFTNKPQ